MSHILHEVAQASVAFESRWQYAAVKRVDPELHARFLEQLEKFQGAVRSYNEPQMERQGYALIRGYGALVDAMIYAGVEEEEVLIGMAASGLRVAIGRHAAHAAQANFDTIFLTPDEVATLLEAHPEIVRIKSLFPGAAIERASIKNPTKIEEAAQ